MYLLRILDFTNVAPREGIMLMNDKRALVEYATNEVLKILNSPKNKRSNLEVRDDGNRCHFIWKEKKYYAMVTNIRIMIFNSNNEHITDRIHPYVESIIG